MGSARHWPTGAVEFKLRCQNPAKIPRDGTHMDDRLLASEYCYVAVPAKLPTTRIFISYDATTLSLKTGSSLGTNTAAGASTWMTTGSGEKYELQ